MDTDSESTPPWRIWTAEREHGDPPLPRWMEDIWTQHGRPNPSTDDRFAPAAQALLWFVSTWYAWRKPYRFGLPPALLKWLNATELDLTTAVERRPTLEGSVTCGAFKPVSRFMYLIWEQAGRTPSLEDSDNYYEFLEMFARETLPRLNAPRALLPQAAIDLLNAPAGDEDLPLTVGMLLYLRRRYPEEYRQPGKSGRERMLAHSFQALEELLELGDPRMIPAAVSGFWNQRPLASGAVTAFEYVAARAADDAPSDEAGIRHWSGRNVISGLVSGPPTSLAGAVEPVTHIEDRAIVIYRDHVTVAGLSKAGASMGAALPGNGVPVFDLHFSLGRERLDTEAERNRKHWINARRKAHIFNLNPEYLADCCYCNLARMGAGDYTIGQFFWELSAVSRVHKPGIALVDEIWTASDYLTRIYGAATSKPVATMGLMVSVNGAAALKAEQFGFGDDAYLFLSTFDAGSVVERKNPLGTITAFQKAFPRGTERVGLIIKTRNLEHLQTPRDRKHWAEAQDRIRKDDRIKVVKHTMTDDELAGLCRMCQCFVSLHRSEGFGFGPAEAMAQGKPVIVTNYSGVCDFCTPETAKLVDYELIRVKPDEYPFLDADQIYEWADPNLNGAAEYMRMLAEDREQGLRLGCAGKALMLREYSVEAVRRRYLTRLEQLGFGCEGPVLSRC